jgi:undecaprenyl diphosphate synthase
MSEVKIQSIPSHVGIIMDGNRRWANERNLPTLEGHFKGYEKMRLMPEWFFSRGVKAVSVFAFSTENWQRSREEVNYLMKLLKTEIEQEAKDTNNKSYKVVISGRIEELPGDLPDACRQLIETTKNNNRGILNICLNYGGQAEIVDVVAKIIKNNIELEQIHEGMIRKYLYHGDLPDLDAIIRTSGEQRLSGFMLWQSVYSELFFLKKYWPDFEEGDVDHILQEYALRKRRFGGD